MALVPDAVFYLRLGVEELIPRVVFSRGFDYWESGMDVFPGHDMYESFRTYQTALLAEFDRLGEEYDFKMIDASAEPRVVFAQLRAKILSVLESDSRAVYLAKSAERTAMAVPAASPIRIERAPVAPTPAEVNREIDLLFQTMVAHYSARAHVHSNGHANGNGNGDSAHHQK